MSGAEGETGAEGAEGATVEEIKVLRGILLAADGKDVPCLCTRCQVEEH